MLDVNTKAAKVEQLTGYSFINKLLAAEAVQMAAPKVAIVYENPNRGVPNNKRLSILGNAILTKVLCGIWYEASGSRGRELNPGDWTTIRNDILCNDSLAGRGFSLGVDTCTFCNEGTVVSAKMVATTLEAIIGAVFHDGGDEAVARVVSRLDFANHPLLM